MCAFRARPARTARAACRFSIDIALQLSYRVRVQDLGSKVPSYSQSTTCRIKESYKKGWLPYPYMILLLYAPAGIFIVLMDMGVHLVPSTWRGDRDAT